MRIACLALLAVGMAGAQALPSYDVVSVKPNVQGPGVTRVSIHSGTFLGLNVSLAELLGVAYDLQPRLVLELPKWAETARFDVSAKVSEPDARVLKGMSKEEREGMLAGALADRFSVKVHRETRTLPVYELVIDKGGIKFALDDPKAEIAPGALGRGSMNSHAGELTGVAVSMGELTEYLSRQVDRSVVDKTGLLGKYDVQLKYLPEGRPETDDAPAPLVTALPEQLGLRLVATKGPVEVVVVDQVKMPEAN